MHPIVIFGSAFVGALLLLWLVLISGQWIGRRKLKKLKKAGKGLPFP